MPMICLIEFVDGWLFGRASSDMCYRSKDFMFRAEKSMSLA